MNHSTAPVLVITGMHRSGTSVITAAFASAGLDVGPRLMPAAQGNPHGHFEDLDFVSLHERILRANGIAREGFTVAVDIPVPPSLSEEARTLIEQRREGGKAWGWKDPRTTLFLEWWADLLPDARFILLVRSPAEAIDSLFRRGDDAFALNPVFALDVWMAYNRRIHEFALAHPDRCLVVDSETAVADPSTVVATVQKRWSISLTEPEMVVDQRLFQRQVIRGRRALVSLLRPDATRLYATLATLAGRTDVEAEPAANQHEPVVQAVEEWARGARSDALAIRTATEIDSLSQQIELLIQERDDAQREIELLLQRPIQEPAPKKPLRKRLSREAKRLASQAGWLVPGAGRAQRIPGSLPPLRGRE